MGVFGVVFGCRGDGGFNGRCLGVSIGDGGFMLACISGCRGVIGFNVATSQQPVREKVRPARPGVDASAKKFAQRAQNTPNMALLCQQGEFCFAQGQICLVLGEECLANGCCNQARSPRGDLYANGAAGMRG